MAIKTVMKIEDDTELGGQSLQNSCQLLESALAVWDAKISVSFYVHWLNTE